jgi:hypothetical protein
MFQILNYFDSVNLVSFGQGDILNIGMTLLYSWLIVGDFNIYLQVVLCVEAGSTCLFTCFLFFDIVYIIFLVKSELYHTENFIIFIILTYSFFIQWTSNYLSFFTEPFLLQLLNFRSFYVLTSFFIPFVKFSFYNGSVVLYALII